MQTPNTEFNALNAQFENLRKEVLSNSKKRVLKRVLMQQHAEKRQTLLALIGFCVSVTACFVFIARNDTFGFLVLPIVATVMLFTAWSSCQRYKNLTQDSNPNSFLIPWEKALTKKIKEIKILGPLIALQFAALTGFVIYVYGIFSFKANIYLLTCSAIFIYVIYHLFLTLPQIKNELSLLHELED